MKKSMEPPSCQEGLVNIGLEAESKKLPSSIYKGVVPQPNGRWGAQIYDKHQRVWLGTFDEEEQAAHTYDIAALRFRGNNAITNFRLSLDANKDDVEHYFLNSHSKDEIVDMLRKHSYAYELEQTRYNISACNNGEFEDIPESDPFGVDREELFEKVLTPSDVGKLNRMVIPKQQAERYFPLPIESAAKGVLLSLEDEAGKVWRFRYCYWSSSQSYVLTKGWTRFVKEKNLKAGDRICFQRSGEPENCRLFIGCRPPQMGSSLVGMSDQENSSKSVETTRLIRLFGVNILEAPTNHVL